MAIDNDKFTAAKRALNQFRFSTDPQNALHYYRAPHEQSQPTITVQELNNKGAGHLQAGQLSQYWWRRNGPTPTLANYIPVTRAELKLALAGNLRSNKVSLGEIDKFIGQLFSDQDNDASAKAWKETTKSGVELDRDPGFVQAIDRQDLAHYLSPDDLTLSTTVLRILSDAGVKYELEVAEGDNEGAPQLWARTLDREHKRVLIMDVAHPESVGRVKTNRGFESHLSLENVVLQSRDDPEHNLKDPYLATTLGGVVSQKLVNRYDAQGNPIQARAQELNYTTHSDWSKREVQSQLSDIFENGVKEAPNHFRKEGKRQREVVKQGGYRNKWQIQAAANHPENPTNDGLFQQMNLHSRHALTQWDKDLTKLYMRGADKKDKNGKRKRTDVEDENGIMNVKATQVRNGILWASLDLQTKQRLVLAGMARQILNPEQVAGLSNADQALLAPMMKAAVRDTTIRDDNQVHYQDQLDPGLLKDAHLEKVALMGRDRELAMQAYAGISPIDHQGQRRYADNGQSLYDDQGKLKVRPDQVPELSQDQVAIINSDPVLNHVIVRSKADYDATPALPVQVDPTNALVTVAQANVANREVDGAVYNAGLTDTRLATYDLLDMYREARLNYWEQLTDQHNGDATLREAQGNLRQLLGQEALTPAEQAGVLEAIRVGIRDAKPVGAAFGQLDAYLNDQALHEGVQQLNERQQAVAGRIVQALDWELGNAGLSDHDWVPAGKPALTLAQGSDDAPLDQGADDDQTEMGSEDQVNDQNQELTATEGSNDQPRFAFSKLVNLTKRGLGQQDYVFEQNDRLSHSPLREYLVGMNELDRDRVQERGIQFDYASARSLADLRQADPMDDPVLAYVNSDHYRQLAARAKEEDNPQLVFDDPQNPMPRAFRADGQGLINPETKEAFQVRMLDKLKAQLKQRGVNASDEDILIDARGEVYINGVREQYATTNRLKSWGPQPIIDPETKMPLTTMVKEDVVDEKTGEIETKSRFARPDDVGVKVTYIDFATKGSDSAAKLVAPNGKLWPKPDDSEEVLATKQRYRDVVEGLIEAHKNGTPVPIDKPIQLEFGQLMAPEHDGTLKTNFYSYGGKRGQKTFLPRYQGRVVSPNQDAWGNIDPQAYLHETTSGVGMYDRVRVTGYEQGLSQAVHQAVDSMLQSGNLGMITTPRDRTLLNGVVAQLLAEPLEASQEHRPITRESQAALETQTKALRFGEEDMQTTAATNLINDSHVLIDHLRELAHHLRQTGREFDINDASPEVQAVLKAYLHDPMAMRDYKPAAQLADPRSEYFVSNKQTGQGRMYGILQYISDGAFVTPEGILVPAAFKKGTNQLITPKDVADAKADTWEKVEALLAHDENGELVGVQTGTVLEQQAIFDRQDMATADRAPVGLEQAQKANAIVDDTKIATMSLGGMTLEDGAVVSKAYAEAHQVWVEDGNGEGHFRPLKVGDKISDPVANKATIGKVIDPDMDPAAADEAGIGDVVALMHDNPDLDVVLSPSAPISRQSPGSILNYVDQHQGGPISYRPMVYDQATKMYHPGEPVQTNATINQGTILLTNQTLEHKVTRYDVRGGAGRKMSILMANADTAKNATHVANYFRKQSSALKQMREYGLMLGLDFYPDKTAPYDPNALLHPDTDDPNLTAVPTINPLATPAEQAEINKKFSTTAYQAEQDKALDAFIKGAKPGADPDELLRALIRPAAARLGALRHSSQPLFGTPQEGAKFDPKGTFMARIEDGGVMTLPKGLELNFLTKGATTRPYIPSAKLRKRRVGPDGAVIISHLEQQYQAFAQSLALYETYRSNLEPELVKKMQAAGWPKDTQQRALQRFYDVIAKRSGVQSSWERVQDEANKKLLGGSDPRNGMIRNDVLGGYSGLHSASSVVTSDINLPVDTIAVSPAMAETLGFEANEGDSGLAHMKGHPEWQFIHAHRDPLWREQGSLGFRIKIDPTIDNVAMNPVFISDLDGDYDGDQLGLIAMPDAACQEELGTVANANRWILDNDAIGNNMNLKAELIETGFHTNHELRFKDGQNHVHHAKLLDDNGQLNDQSVTMLYEGIEKRFGAPNELIPSDWRDRLAASHLVDDKGKVNDPDQTLKNPKTKPLTYSDVVNALANDMLRQEYHSLKQKKRPTEFKDEHALNARQRLDELVQNLRGFDTYREKGTGEVKRVPGSGAGMLKGDGIDYTSLDTLEDGLNQIVAHGSKGSFGKVQSLLHERTKLPTQTAQREAAQAQVNADGTLNTQGIAAYRAMLRQVEAAQAPIQLATNDKTEMTGVPGRMQQMLTSFLGQFGQPGLHLATALGQPGTQRVLSIKRDPKEAQIVAEMMIGPLGELMRGRANFDQGPVFSLMGKESQGGLGDDLLTVSQRVATIHDLAHQDYHNQAGRYGTMVDGHYQLGVTKEQQAALIQKLGLPVSGDAKEAQGQVAEYMDRINLANHNWFGGNLAMGEALPPAVQARVRERTKEMNAESDPKFRLSDEQLATMAVPSLWRVNRQTQKPEPTGAITAPEMSVLAEVLYDGIDGLPSGQPTLGLKIEPHYFAELAEYARKDKDTTWFASDNGPVNKRNQYLAVRGADGKLTVTDHALVPMQNLEAASRDDQTSGVSLLERANMAGLKAFSNDNYAWDKSSMFGEAGSTLRQTRFGNMSDEELQAMLALQPNDLSEQLTAAHSEAAKANERLVKASDAQAQAQAQYERQLKEREGKAVDDETVQAQDQAFQAANDRLARAQAGADKAQDRITRLEKQRQQSELLDKYRDRLQTLDQTERYGDQEVLAKDRAVALKNVKERVVGNAVDAQTYAAYEARAKQVQEHPELAQVAPENRPTPTAQPARAKARTTKATTPQPEPVQTSLDLGNDQPTTRYAKRAQNVATTKARAQAPVQSAAPQQQAPQQQAPQQQAPQQQAPQQQAPQQQAPVAPAASTVDDRQLLVQAKSDADLIASGYAPQAPYQMKGANGHTLSYQTPEVLLTMMQLKQLSYVDRQARLSDDARAGLNANMQDLRKEFLGWTYSQPHSQQYQQHRDEVDRLLLQHVQAAGYVPADATVKQTKQWLNEQVSQWKLVKGRRAEEYVLQLFAHQPGNEDLNNHLNPVADLAQTMQAQNQSNDNGMSLG